MNNNLSVLLQQYEQKRLHALRIAEENKNNLYKTNKKFKEIEDALNSVSLETINSILISKNSEKSEFLNTLKQKSQNLIQEKQELLESLGLNKNYLEPPYICKKCNDTGYISINNTSHMCNCLKQELFNLEFNKSNISNLELENFDTFDINLYSPIPDEKKYNCKISPRDNIKTIKKISRGFIDNFNNSDEKNLLFTGNPGLGKTFLCNCIAKELLNIGKTVLYQTAPVMLNKLVDYQFNKTDSLFDIYNNILNADLLIIDDLGTETMNKMKFTELFNVINSRLLNQNNRITKTIISTNLTLENLYSYYDERIVSRLIGSYNLCKFFGEDIRFKKAKK